MRHPFVLAGLAVVALLGLTAAVLVIIDSARGSEATTAKVIIDQTTATAGPTSKTAEAGGIHGTTKRTTTVRSAPGATTPPLGTLPVTSDAVIDGRTTDTKWLQIIFPPRSELHGWVEADMLDVTGDPTTLAVATAEPAPVVEVPTKAPRAAPAPDEATVKPAPTEPLATATEAGVGLPDLVIGTTPTITGGRLFVTVTNQGPGPAHGDLVVAVFEPDGVRLLGGTTLPGLTLGPGRSIDVGTGLAVSGTQKLLLVVDPNGDIDETDNTNNRVLIEVAVGEPPTVPPVAETPLPETPTPEVPPADAPPAPPPVP